MSESSNPFLSVSGKKPTCMEMLQLILDGQASSDQREYFKAHMDSCRPCFKNYELDMAIKQLLQSKCCGGEAPCELEQMIRERIAQSI